jgi:membrane-associated phospholipid phosphatase
MSQTVARAVSIVLHPLLALPAAVLALSAARGSDARTLATIASGFALFGALLLGWSRHQVRRGRWAHIDASAGHERRHLHRGLLPAVALGAALAWWSAPGAIAAAALLCALLPLALAPLLARWCKLSLHAAFAAYAGGLLWALSPAWALLGALLAAAVAWSRLRLSRHAPRDLLAGLAAGAAAAALCLALLDAGAGA